VATPRARRLRSAVITVLCLAAALALAWWQWGRMRHAALEHILAASAPRPGAGMGEITHLDLLAPYGAWAARFQRAPSVYGLPMAAAPGGRAAPGRVATPADLAPYRPLLADLGALLARGLGVNLAASSQSAWYPGFQPLGDAARVWCVAATADGDPTPALDGLDALQASASPAFSLYGLRTARAIAYYRDTAYVRAFSAGKLPDARLRSWLAEPGFGRPEDLLPALEAERTCQLPVRAHLLEDLGPRGFWNLDRQLHPGSDPDDTVAAWWRLDQTVAADLARLDRAEDRFGPATAPAAAAPWHDDADGDLVLPANLAAEARGSAHCEAHHRICVAQVRVLMLVGRTGVLPATTPAGLDLVGGRDRLPLRYVRRDDGHFAVEVAASDPARPDYDRVRPDSAPQDWVTTATGARPAAP
jgi:hypothetical protein